jgi:hypothetical protein
MNTVAVAQAAPATARAERPKRTRSLESVDSYRRSETASGPVF